MLTISIILNVVLVIWIYFLNRHDRWIGDLLKVEEFKVKAFKKALHDTKLEYQGIIDQFYKERGEL